MAEYYAVLSKACAGLESNSTEARRAVFDKARNALIGQLRAIDPPLPTAEISRQRLELEEAIRRVEREASSAAPSAAPGRTAPARASTPTPRAPGVAEPAPESADGRPSPQEVFRRAIQEAESRGAGQFPPLERAPAAARLTTPDQGATGDGSWASRKAERGAAAEVPNSAPPRGYSENQRSGSEPRLAPDYDYEWEPQPQAQPARLQENPYVDRRDRPASTRRGRRGQASVDDPRLMETRARPSRLPAILLLVLILAMAGGLAAFGWSQRAIIRDVIAGWDSGNTQSAPPAPVVTTETSDEAAAALNKNPDRLLSGEAADAAVRVVDPQSPVADGGADSGSATAMSPSPPALPLQEPAVDVDAIVAQKAVLYEEPVDPAAAAAGVVAIDAAVTWSFIADGAEGPEIAANIDVPGRKMKIQLTIRRNSDASLPASHLVEVVVDTPADFPGQGIKNVPRLVLKPSEEARGQPLIGASARITDGFFWIALSGVQSDVTANMGMLRDGAWIDLPLVYESGQRAILTIDKGTPGERVFQKALAAWAG